MAVRITNEPPSYEHIESEGIFKAAEQGNLEEVKEFIKQGVSVNERDSESLNKNKIQCF